MQMEIINLQNNKILYEMYNNVELGIFIQNILTRRHLFFETAHYDVCFWHVFTDENYQIEN